MILMRFIKKLTAFICVAAVAASSLVVNASADEPYIGYNYDWWGDPIPSQNGFVVEDVISGAEMGAVTLAEPNDLFVHNETGKFYIVDTKNNRIIVVNENWENIVTFSTKNPRRCAAPGIALKIHYFLRKESFRKPKAQTAFARI